ncbi:MAG: tetratricopeptide repeat protein [Anaerolineae bacterium]|nr:tetratricopeptide repeat protein [Anaerolineae bacterium]
MNQSMQRAVILYQQAKYDLAEKELWRALATDPHNADAHRLLALTLNAQGKDRGALREARQSIHLAPDSADNHYTLARILKSQRRTEEAHRAIEEAIRLDPQQSYFFALLANLHLQARHWRKARDVAQQGLALNPEDVTCINIRAMALIKLDQAQEADDALTTALAKDPENSITHANQGWFLLEQGNREAAMSHFREALRLDPNLGWARAGVVESLKARNPVYRLLLRYFFFMSRLTSDEQLVAVGGLALAMGTFRSLTCSFPLLLPIYLPVWVVYQIFVYLSWTGEVLFNLLLRLDKFGRLVLSEEEIKASHWAAACLIIAVLGIVVWPLVGSPATLITVPWGLLMLVPVSGTVGSPPGCRRQTLAVYTVVLGVVGLSGLALIFFHPALVFLPLPCFGVGVMLFTLVANIVRNFG